MVYKYRVKVEGIGIVEVIAENSSAGRYNLLVRLARIVAAYGIDEPENLRYDIISKSLLKNY